MWPSSQKIPMPTCSPLHCCTALLQGTPKPPSLAPTRVVVVNRGDLGAVADGRRLVAQQAHLARGAWQGFEMWAGCAWLGCSWGSAQACKHAVLAAVASTHPPPLLVLHHPSTRTLGQLAAVAEDEQRQVAGHLQLEAQRVGGVQPKLCARRAVAMVGV